MGFAEAVPAIAITATIATIINAFLIFPLLYFFTTKSTKLTKNNVLLN